MSNSLWSNLLHQRFLPSSVLEYRSRIGSPSYLGGSSLFQSQVNSQKRKPPLLTELCTDRFTLQKKKFPMAHQPSVSGSIQAKLATNPSSEQIGEKFNLEGNMELQVDVKPPTSGHVLVDFKVTSSSKGLFLHWGAIKSGKEWILPHHRPNGTIVYKNRALRTPLVQSGSYAVLRLDIDDPAIQAIEFVIYHEPQNKWIKNSDNNFHVKIPPREPQRPLRLPQSNVSVPEDLVQMQAYLRWERKGKQTYNPQQEKEEYEAARTELLEEITRGTSIVDIRARLMKKNDKVELKEQAPAKTKGTLPIELVQTQAYIRWEKAGKPIYSSVEQNKEFEEAKKELQLELEKGISLEELRKKVVKGEIQTKVAKKQEKRCYSSMEKIQRKKRDVAQLINKDASGEQILGAAQVLSRIERFSKSKEGQVDGPIITKKIYKIGNSELMVLVAKPSGKTKVYLATDLNEPVILHWALSRKPGEWLAPPANVLPHGSVSSHHYAETQFSSCVSDNLSDRIQSLEIGIGDGDFTGMPFVLLTGRNWIKDRGSDFYVDFSTQPKQDGEGTAKALLDKIANMESEAQKSLRCSVLGFYVLF